MRKVIMMSALVCAFCMSACESGKGGKLAYDIKGTWEKSAGDTVFVLGEDTAGNEVFLDTVINGGSFSLSSLRGNYVVLDFWASWCAPCRAEIPNLKSIYAKHKADGLKMVSVSLDKDEAKWKEAVKAEDMEWIQASSLEGFNCSSAKSFGVNSIPSIFVIGKDGSILSGGLRGKELVDMVDGLF